MNLRSSGRQPPRGSAGLDLTASALIADDELDQARAFYQSHADEIVSRMRNPTSASNNPAALIVAQCATDPRLRAEALCAIDDARRANDALATLNMTLSSYGFDASRSRVGAKGA